MPSNPISPAAAANYIGFGKQSVKGTGVAPAYFAAYIEQVDLAHNQAIRQIREGGKGLYVARDVKDVHAPGFRFAAPARPDITAAIMAYFLGADSVSGGGDPYTHVLTPTEAMTWLSLERNINDEVTERLVDGFFLEVQVDIRKRDAGPETVLIVTGGALSPTWQASPTAETYETARPWLRSDATWKLDGNTETNVERATLTMRWVVDESLLADDLTRADAVKLAFEADLTVVQIFEATADLDAYRATHYGSSSGTAADETVYQPDASESFEVDLSYNAAGPVERAVTFLIPKVAWTEAKLTEPTPNASEAVKLTRTGHLIHDTTPLTVTAVNSLSADLA
jgi:hypothetical protein